ncbi:MAG: hypothetical protein K8I30_24100 [Anaerolineae bacterium]|nr:hypothetical protein [Anaerolineae bacterium]
MTFSIPTHPEPHAKFMPGYALDEMLRDEVDALVRDLKGTTPPPVTERDLIGLPDPVQRYLIASRIVGKPRTAFARIRLKGEFRRAANQNWMPMVSEQYNRIDQPARLWYAAMKFMPLLNFYVRDAYLHGEGNMYARLTPWYRMFDQRSPELTQGELLTYLNDMFMFPSALLHESIRWEAVDDRAARAYLTAPSGTVSAVFYFNERDEVVNFVAERYRTVGKTYELNVWTTPLWDYAEVKGVRIPTRGEATWELADGPLCYIRTTLVDIDYNVFERYP